MQCGKKRCPWCCSFRMTQALIVFVACLGYAVVAYHRVCPSILFTDISRDLNVTTQHVGYFSSMYFWPYAISQPFIGLLVDLVEPAYVMAVAHTLSAIGSVLVGFAPSFAVSCAGRALVGLGAGAIMVPVCKVFAHWFTDRGFFIFQGLVLASGAAGGVVAQGPLAAIIQTVNWRTTFYAAAVVGVFVGLLTLLFRGRPEAMGFDRSQVYGMPRSSSNVDSPLLDKQPGYDATRARQRLGVKGQWRLLWSNIKKVLGNKFFWTLVLWDGLVPGAYYNVSSMWGGPYLQDVFRFSEQKTANLLILINLAWILGTPLLTFVSEALHTRKWIMVVTALCEIAVSVAFIFMKGPSQWNNIIIVILIFAFGFFGSAPCSLAVTMFKEMETPETAGTAMGCSNFFPFICSTLMHSVTSYILENVDGVCEHCREYRGYLWALWVPTIACAGIGFLGVLLTKETFQEPEAEQSVTTIDTKDEVIESYTK